LCPNGTLNSWFRVSNLTARELLFLWREYVLPRWGFLVSLTVLTAFTVAAELFGPSLLQRTIDAATQGKGWLWFAVGFLLVTLAALAARVVIGTVASRLAFATTNALRADVLRHVMGLGLAFRDRTPVGDTMQVLEGDIGSLSNVLSSLVGQVIVQALVVLGVIVVAFVLHPLAGSSVLACVLFAWLVLRRSPAQNALLWREARERQAASSALTYSHLNARADLTLNRGQVYSLRGFAQARAAFKLARALQVSIDVLLPVADSETLRIRGKMEAKGVKEFGERSNATVQRMAKEIALKLSQHQAAIVTALIFMTIVSVGLIIAAFGTKNLTEGQRYFIGLGGLFCIVVTIYAFSNVYFISEKIGLFR
jgi:ABC-type multidrug transport system fused ATPase/permease subunit